MKAAGIPSLGQADFDIIPPKSKEWGKFYQYPRKQAGRIPIQVVEAWGEIVLDSNKNIAERLFALSFRVSATACLRCDVVLTTSPSTAVLMKEVPIWGPQQKPKPWGEF